MRVTPQERMKRLGEESNSKLGVGSNGWSEMARKAVGGW